MTALARTVFVGPMEFAAGTDSGDIPNLYLQQIRNPRVWVGGVLPEAIGPAPEEPISLSGLTPSAIRAALSLESFSSSVWRLTDHGVAADGETVETQAAQDAIDEAPDGSLIVFPQGTLVVDDWLIARPGKFYLGDGYALAGYSGGAVIKQADGANIGDGLSVSGLLVSEAWATDATGCDTPIWISNIAFDGNADENPDSSASGLVLVNYWTRVDQVYSFNMPQHGIVLTDVTADGENVIENSSSEYRIEHLKVDNVAGSGFVQVSENNISSQDGYLIHPLISNTGMAGISMARGSGWLIDRAHLYGIGTDGITLGACYGTEIRSHYIEDFGSAGETGGYYAGIRMTQLDGRGSRVIGGFIGSTEPVADATYHYLELQAGFEQTDARIQVSGTEITGVGTTGDGTQRIGLVVQHDEDGVLTVDASALRITNVATERYVASGDTLTIYPDSVRSARISKGSGESQTPAADSVTPLTLGTQEWNYGEDTFDLTTANKIEVLRAGQYLIMADACFEGGGTGARNLLTTVNGTVVKDNGQPGTDGRPSSTTLRALSAGDQIGLSVWVTGSSDPSVTGAAAKDTGVTVVYLGP